MPERKDEDYILMAGLVLGLAFPDMFSSFILLMQKAKTARKTGLWKFSLFTAITLVLFIASQVVILDFLASPYMVPDGYLGILLMSNYATNLMVTIGITLMFVYRISLFFGSKSASALLMAFFGALTIIAKGVANGFGLKLGYNTYQGLYGLAYKEDPIYRKVPILISGAMAGEAVFATIGALLFLSYLTGRTGLSGLARESSMNLKREIFRIYLITLINGLALFFGIWVALDDNYVSHIAYYMPSFIYSLELFCFIDLSYNSARTIINEQAIKSDPSKIYLASDVEPSSQGTKFNSSVKSQLHFPRSPVYEFKERAASKMEQRSLPSKDKGMTDASEYTSYRPPEFQQTKNPESAAKPGAYGASVASIDIIDDYIDIEEKPNAGVFSRYFEESYAPPFQIQNPKSIEDNEYYSPYDDTDADEGFGIEIDISKQNNPWL